MSSIFVLIPLSLVLLGIAVWGLLWAIERRQFVNVSEFVSFTDRTRMLTADEALAASAPLLRWPLPGLPAEQDKKS